MTDRAPGWDQKEIQRIVDDHFGGKRENLANFLNADTSAHNWHLRISKAICKTFDSIEKFSAAYPPHPQEIMTPLEAIKSDPPNVWLTMFDGFGPESWGNVGFTDERQRKTFLKRTRPGALVVICGGPKSGPDMRRNIIGILQVTHQTGDASNFIRPDVWQIKQANPKEAGKWNFAVKVVRAWRIIPESYMPVTEFAPETYTKPRGNRIGSAGMQLTRNEAQNILKLEFEETEVWDAEAPIDGSADLPEDILSPSKAGPVSQSPHSRREAEGPKHLYVLALKGKLEHFLAIDVGNKFVVKVGMSKSPMSRRDEHNKSFPGECAFKWELRHSTFEEKREPFPSSKHAIAGEDAMKAFLAKNAKSLGGEFFLADENVIQTAWSLGKKTAGEFTS